MITTLLDHQAAPADQVRDTYLTRWSASETTFGEDQATIAGAGNRTSGPVLRSGTPRLVISEAWAWLAGTQLVHASAAAPSRAPARPGCRPGPRPHRGGKPELGARQAATVRRMYQAADPDGERLHTVAEIAQAVGVSDSYRTRSGWSVFHRPRCVSGAKTPK